MSALHPEISARLARERIGDALRDADRTRRAAPFRPAAVQRRARADLARVVQAEPAHRPALAAFLARLTPGTIYRRFFTPVLRPADRDLDQLLRSDGERLAVVALLDDEVIGYAMAVRSEPDGVVELAVVVEDAWQRHGLAPRLIRALLDHEPAAGAPTLSLVVLGINRPALRMVRRRWPQARAALDGDVVRLTAPRIAPAGPSVEVDF